MSNAWDDEANCDPLEDVKAFIKQCKNARTQPTSYLRPQLFVGRIGIDLLFEAGELLMWAAHGQLLTSFADGEYLKQKIKEAQADRDDRR